MIVMIFWEEPSLAENSGADYEMEVLLAPDISENTAKSPTRETELWQKMHQ